jgi:hypothetical protein
MSRPGLVTLPNALVTKLSTPFVACVGLGLASSSYFFLGNVACATIGVLPAIKATELEEGKKVELWAYFYEKAAIQFVTSASLSATSYFLAAKFANPLYISLRPWLIAAGVCSISVLPYTFFAMIPVNNKLLATRDLAVQTQNFKTDGTSLPLIQKWQKLHLTRMAVGGISWLIGFSALVLA